MRKEENQTETSPTFKEYGFTATRLESTVLYFNASFYCIC